MTTVLDALRRCLLDDDVADGLEFIIDILTARALGKLLTQRGTNELLRVGRNDPRADPFIEQWLVPSTGYEPLLMEMGWDQFAARGMAKSAVRRGKQQAAESKAHRQVVKDIRYLAKARASEPLLFAAPDVFARRGNQTASSATFSITRTSTI